MVQVAGLGMLIPHRRQGADTNYWHTPRLLTITKIILILHIIILGDIIFIYFQNLGEGSDAWTGPAPGIRPNPHLITKNRLGVYKPPTPTLRPSHVLSSSFDHIQGLSERMAKVICTAGQGSLLISKLEFFIKADFRGLVFL